MKTINDVLDGAQGPKSTVEEVSADNKVISILQFRDWVKRDVGIAISCLEAIYRDVDTCNAVAEYLHGRYVNAKHKEELKKQGDLGFKE